MRENLMTRVQRNDIFLEESINPFESNNNSDTLRLNLDKIDERNIRCTFKSTTDPIQYAFESFEQVPLTMLAKDFISESFSDIVSFVTNIIRN